MSQLANQTPAPQLLQTHDLVVSLPTPYLRLLVLFARPISGLRHLLEVVFWTPGRRVESWMVVGVWWALCLGSQPAFRYLLPPLMFLPLIPLSSLSIKGSKQPPPINSASTPSTSDTVLVTLSDLNAIYLLLPSSALPSASDIYARFRQLGIVRLIRGLVVLWATWIVLGQFVVGYKTLLAIIGTILLLLPSPPFVHLTHLLSKSLFFRRGLALAFLFTFGSPPETSYRFKLNFSIWGWFKSKWTASRRPSFALSLRPKMSEKPKGGSALDVEEEKEKDVRVEAPIYFRFEIHENQRWWMGLDWTSALLPQERPSWCDSHLQPVSPPSSFPLPAPVSVVINTATMKDRYARVMRSAQWKWLDEDWSIVRYGPGLTSTNNNVQPVHSAPNQPSEIDFDPGYSVSSPAQPQSPSQNRTSSFAGSFGTSPSSHAPAMEESASFSGTRAQSIAEQAFTKGLERLKARAVSSVLPGSAAPSSPRRSGETSRSRTGSHEGPDEEVGQASSHLPGQQAAASAAALMPAETVPEKDAATDADGWVYGDNKWENVGAKGGLGKYTRRRRWQRRAVCIETVRKLSPSEDPPIEVSLASDGSGAVTPRPVSLAAGGPSSPLKAKPAVGLAPPQTDLKGRAAVDIEEDVVIPENKMSATGSAATGAEQVSRDEMLRMRLKKAMGSMGA